MRTQNGLTTFAPPSGSVNETFPAGCGTGVAVGAGVLVGIGVAVGCAPVQAALRATSSRPPREIRLWWNHLWVCEVHNCQGFSRFQHLLLGVDHFTRAIQPSSPHLKRRLPLKVDVYLLRREVDVHRALQPDRYHL